MKTIVKLYPTRRLARHFAEQYEKKGFAVEVEKYRVGSRVKMVAQKAG